MAADAASFRTEICSTSSGFTIDMSPGTPSIITRGSDVLIVVTPRSRNVPVDPGAFPSLVTLNPATAPCSAVDKLVECLSAIACSPIVPIAPVRSFFFMVP